MAQLGFRTMDEMIGRVDRLDCKPAVDHWKARGLDFSAILHQPEVGFGTLPRCVRKQDHGLELALDNQLIAECAAALEHQTPVSLDLPIRNVNRTVGTMLGYQVTRRYGAAGLPDDTIQLQFTGSAGQSFGAFVPNGITLNLEGDSNDYVGKGLSGGRLIVYPPRALDVRRRGQHHHRQRRALRRHQRRGLHPRTSPASGSRSATAARWRSSRASAITAANT